MGFIRIPFASKSEQYEPLRACIERAAIESGLTEFQVANVMSLFLEELSEQMGKNKLVRIPCFGIFGAKTWNRDYRKSKLKMPTCYPAFSGARPLRNLVSLKCTPTQTVLDAFLYHRKHVNSRGQERGKARMPGSAGRRFRLQVNSQARQIGMKS